MNQGQRKASNRRLYSRSNALRDAGQYDRALADYETALKLAPTNALVLVDRGRAYARMGRSEAPKKRTPLETSRAKFMDFGLDTSINRPPTKLRIEEMFGIKLHERTANGSRPWAMCGFRSSKERSAGSGNF
jgi:tetratricopeptide (TPR) repeat protein